MTGNRMKHIQALHAGISRRDWNVTEQAANALRDEYELVTRILAGTDIGSLPHDKTLPEMAQERTSPAASIVPTHDDRIALASALTWDVTNILPNEVSEIIERLHAAGYSLVRLGAETLTNALAKYDEGMSLIGGCGDGNCVIQRPKGQHTNGGCRCAYDRAKAPRAMSLGRWMAEEVRKSKPL